MTRISSGDRLALAFRQSLQRCRPDTAAGTRRMSAPQPAQSLHRPGGGAIARLPAGRGSEASDRSPFRPTILPGLLRRDQFRHRSVRHQHRRQQRHLFRRYADPAQRDRPAEPVPDADALGRRPGWKLPTARLAELAGRLDLYCCDAAARRSDSVRPSDPSYPRLRSPERARARKAGHKMGRCSPGNHGPQRGASKAPDSICGTKRLVATTTPEPEE
jgi:hypothetical protein